MLREPDPIADGLDAWSGFFDTLTRLLQKPPPPASLPKLSMQIGKLFVLFQTLRALPEN